MQQKSGEKCGLGCRATQSAQTVAAVHDFIYAALAPMEALARRVEVVAE